MASGAARASRTDAARGDILGGMIRVMLASLLLFVAAPAWAPGQERGSSEGALASEPPPLRIGTKITAPFVVEREDGTLDGLSIELWRRLAEELGLSYELEVVGLQEMLDGVAEGKLDAAIAAISVTPDRERSIDFSHAYFTSGLGIAVPTSGQTRGFLRGLTALMTPGFWIAVGTLAVLLLMVGVFAWLAERRTNPEDFGGNAVRGIGNGFWFSAVTMTTVGYGDIAPRSVGGRVVALVWMFVSVIIISTFTGAIASSVTSASLTARVDGPDDLTTSRVAAVRGTTAASSLRDRGASPVLKEDLQSALGALRDGRVDAVVHDAPILKHAVAEGFAGEVRVLAAQFELRPYAIVLPEHSGDLEALNVALLEVTGTAAWRAAVKRWGGED